jgi:hypothetical protein
VVQFGEKSKQVRLVMKVTTSWWNGKKVTMRLGSRVHRGQGRRCRLKGARMKWWS